MPINENSPPKWEDTQPVDDQPPKWEDTQPVEHESSLGVVGKYIPDFLNPLAMSEEERAKIKAQTPWQAVKHAGADAASTASMVIPMPGAKGLLGFAARTGAAAATSGVDKALHNVADDKPVMGDVGTSALIGGGVNAGIEAILAPAIKAGALIYRGGKWVMSQAADAITGHKLTQEMLDSPLVQETINKLVSLKGALGIGKNLEGRVADVADEAKGAYTKAVGNIPDEAIPISKVLPDETLRNLDVDTLDNSVRKNLPNYRKGIITNLEKVEFRVDREAKAQLIRDSIIAKKGATQAEKNKLLDKLAKVEDDFSKPLEEALNSDKALKAQIKEVEAANKVRANAKPVTELQDSLAADLSGKQADITGELANRASEIEQYKTLYPSASSAAKPSAKTLPESDVLLRNNLATLDKEISDLSTKTAGQKSGRDSTELGKLRSRRDELVRYLSKKRASAQIPETQPDPMTSKIQTLQDEYGMKKGLADQEAAKLAAEHEANMQMAQQLDQEASQFIQQPVPEYSSAVPAIEGQISSAKAGIRGDILNLERGSAEDIAMMANTADNLPRQTTLREAYNVANTPMKGEINPLTDTLGANVRDLGGESVALADKAKGNMEILNTLSDASVRQDGSLKSAANNILRWGGRAAALTHPMAWATAEIASNPELRYVLGSGLEKLGKWSPKLQDAYNNGGAKAVNVLVNTLNQTDPEFRQAHAGNQQVSPYQEGAEKPQIKRPELSRDDFLRNLSGVESGGKYDATNPNSSATGKYQFLWKTWGDDVSRWAGYPVSQQMFLSNPKLQDLYMKDHHDTTLMRDAKTLRDSSPNASKRSDTELKALVHFKGLAGARKYLDKGIDDTSANNIGVEAYLKRVGGG